MNPRRLFLFALTAAASLFATTAGGAPAGGAMVIEEDFSRGMENWWAEGGEKTWVEEGRLHVRADNPKIEGGGVATVWCRIPHPGSFVLELDAHVVSSSIDANNINLFFCYRDPSGKPLFESRDSRRNGAYSHYHKLEGHIITFLNSPEKERSSVARVRIRRNPGFHLLAETFGGECRQGVTYRLKVTKRGGEIIFAVDDREVLRAVDPQPLGGGLFGLRTYRTCLWWDNIRMRRLEAE